MSYHGEVVWAPEDHEFRRLPARYDSKIPYYISDDGVVMHGEQVLKGKKGDREGHLSIVLTFNGKKEYHYIHRLVADAFIPNPNNYPVVRHLDSNPENNCVENLCWGTVKDNVHDTIAIGNNYIITNEDREKWLCRQRRPIIAENLETGEQFYYESQTEASNVLGIEQANIWKVLNGQREKTCGYYFEYAESVS